MLPTKFEVNLPFSLGEEAKNRFSWPWRPSWIFDQNDFSYFDLLVTPMLPIKFQEIGLLFLEKERKIDSQDGDHLGFPTGTILSIFIYKSP